MIFAVYSKYGNLVGRFYDYDEARKAADRINGYVYSVIVNPWA